MNPDTPQPNTPQQRTAQSHTSKQNPSPFHLSDEMMDEVEHELAAGGISEAEADQLNTALDDMRRGKSPQHFSLDPAFQEAVRLHVATSKQEISPEFSDRLKNHVLQRFADTTPDTAGAHDTSRMQPELLAAHSLFSWKRFVVPLVSVGALAGVAVAVMQTVAPETVQQSFPRNAVNAVGQQIAKAVDTIVPNFNTSNTSNTERPVNTQGNNGSNTNNQNSNASGGQNTNTAGSNSTPTNTTTDSGIALAGVESDINTAVTLAADLERSVAELESIADSLDSFDALNEDAEADSLVNSISTI